MLEDLTPIEDFIIDGMYTRTAYFREGSVIAGCEHKKSGIAILSKGTIRIIDGPDAYEISAPYIYTTKAGSQKLGHALTEAVFTTVHSVESTTTLEAEQELFVGTPQLTRIRNNYLELTEKLGITDEEIQQQMLPAIVEDSDNYYIAPSAIQGVGCFTKRSFSKGETIAIAVVGDTRLGAARYINHSDIPNATLIDYKDSIAVIATANIPQDFEITVNYKRRLLCQQQ